MEPPHGGPTREGDTDAVAQSIDRHTGALGHGMRLYGVLLAVATTTFAWLPAVSRWPPYHPPYERMFIAIFFAWGLCLYRAARAPRQNLGLVDFTALQGLLHGGVMHPVRGSGGSEVVTYCLIVFSVQCV